MVRACACAFLSSFVIGAAPCKGMSNTTSPTRPMFTERHYRAIAAMLGATEQNKLPVSALTAMLVSVFEADNPRFNRALFMRAVAQPVERATYFA